MKGAFLSAALVAALFCYGVGQIASHPAPAPVQVKQDKPNALSPEQKITLEQIQEKAMPILSPKIKDWRKALKNYYKAIENGTVSKDDIVKVAKAYGRMLYAEIPFRQELKASGIPVNTRLQRKNQPKPNK